MAEEDPDETEAQTMEILLCFYETYEPVFCTEEKVAKVMRSFQKKAAKRGGDWRGMMYGEFKKAKGVHPRTFFQRQALKTPERHVPEYVDLESSEKKRVEERAAERRRHDAIDEQMAKKEQQRMAEEIEGRMEWHAAQKAAAGLGRGSDLAPVLEARSPLGPAQKRALTEEEQKSVDRLAQPTVRPPAPPEEAVALARRPPMDREREAALLHRLQSPTREGPKYDHGRSSPLPLERTLRQDSRGDSQRWRPGGAPSPAIPSAEDLMQSSGRRRTPRRTPREGPDFLERSQRWQAEHTPEKRAAKLLAQKHHTGLADERRHPHRPQIGDTSRTLARRSRSAPRMRKAGDEAAPEPQMGPAPPLHLPETLAKLIVHCAW